MICPCGYPYATCNGLCVFCDIERQTLKEAVNRRLAWMKRS